MDSLHTEPPFMTNIGFMLTYKCTISCPHCVMKAGPHRKEEMLLEQAETWIEQARAYRGGHIRALSLTGGEPFYTLAALATLSDYAEQRDFVVSTMTNCFWATSKEAAYEAVARVPAIQLFSLSTDVYHQQAIPFSNIANAVWACKEHDRLYNIAVCTDNEDDPDFVRIVSEIEEIGEGDKIRRAIVFPVGRAEGLSGLLKYQTSTEPTVSACSMASSPIVFPDGRVIGCIGAILTLENDQPLYLGDLQREPLDTILDRAEGNLILHAIRIWGPHKLVALLEQHGKGAVLPKRYVVNSICDVCLQLFSSRECVEALEEILCGRDMRELSAYARAYYLHEANQPELVA